MDRRAFLGSLAVGALGGPRAAAGQPARKVYRIGHLSPLSMTSQMVGPHPGIPFSNVLLLGLRDLGWVYGQHFVIEARGGEGKPERFPNLAAELVRLQVDVIVAGGPVLPALKQATATIPIVMAGAPDPVGDGFAQSLERPGGNFTGLSSQTADAAGKQLELLKELVPGAAPVAVFWDRRHNRRAWQAAERGWKLLSLEIRRAGEIEGAFKAVTSARAGTLLVFASGLLEQHDHRRQIVELAAKSRIPAMYNIRLFVDAGSLMWYGADLIEIYRRAAGFIDKILKGAKAADLPIEQPTKFDLVISLKAARSIGLTIPQSVLLRANELTQ